MNRRGGAGPGRVAERAVVDALTRVHWAVPWLAPYRASGLRVTQWVAEGATVAEALNAELARSPIVLMAGPLSFVPQAELPAGVAYEAHIAATARVPTRELLHDLFNGLVWLRFAPLKRRLNELQVEQLALRRPGDRRGAVRDALTLFDENAAWLSLPPLPSDALARRDWSALFITHRAAWADARPVVFGHGLLEKLTQPRPAITAHAWRVPTDATQAGEAGDDAAQDWLCGHLAPAVLAARGHHPLPVLGVPGWWTANADPAFYADATVFRPPPRVA